MTSKYIEILRRHISSHTKQSEEDRSAVHYLEDVLAPEGRINTSFSSDDKWPNHDGMFEYVPNPDISRRPEQNFIVQIKGTHVFNEKNGVISYSLKSLAFPAYIAYEVTADPGILFLVLNPDIRGKKRIFWKYMSPSFLRTINFEQSSSTIKFYPEDEIKDTDESIDIFCKKLDKVIDTYLFLKKLDNEYLTKKDALEIIHYRCKEISGEIDYLSENADLRDNISRKIVRSLYDLCYSVLVLNAVKLGYKDINQKLAWEVSQFKSETKYMCDFLKGLKYIGIRMPEEGQAERLMLKYYNYLWEIRKFLKDNFDIEELGNLSKFPLNMDRLDEEYYKLVARNIENEDLTPINVRVSRYYIKKINPFFVNGERYFEITLQLAGLYATKYNRITVYSKFYISTKYSIQIAYTEKKLELWGINNKIKILNNWKVSIDPVCLNKMAKMVMMHTQISSKHGEYIELMKFLTSTQMNLLEIINLSNERFQYVYNYIYASTNTHNFGEVILKIRNYYAKSSNKIGRYTIRYALLNLREEVLEALLTNKYNSRSLDGLNITTKCYPFEKKPFISNIAGSKTSNGNKRDIIEIVDDRNKFEKVLPYLKIERMIKETGELYFDKELIATDEEINKYNMGLDSWERNNGFMINVEENIVSIDSYVSTTLFILKRLLQLSHDPDMEQQSRNERYLKECGIKFEDKLKQIAMKYLFVSSQVMLIYGAAGTGKTTLIKYISNMLDKSKKLFLTKTHTALQNLQNRICNIDNISFASIDSVTKSNEIIDFDVIFIDECSTIDNLTMKKLLEKVKEETKLVFSGDIYQIESIDFGNWFYYAKDIITTKGASIELLRNWRTEKGELISLWDEVRKKRPIITEKLSMDGPFSKDLGEEIFELSDDEVVLCLNYDGKFGVNNINQYFQNANTKSKAFSWAEWVFKIGDRIIFLDTRRSSLLYNNLNGTIYNIKKNESSIIFTIDIKIHLTEEQCKYESFDYIDNISDGTRIRLEVIKWNDDLSDEDKIKTVIPFQIAYAISIHKAQGLEFKSVKVVIPSSNAEKITHSVFYTAITRAKENLKIYWSAETMDAIVKSFTTQKVERKTLQLIKQKLDI
jgi:energy-coupling factor transporter ATP-binding protein EcfA2